jgi:hypothetical protein
MVYMMKRNETNAPRIEVGDLIRAYDFEPYPGRPDCYVVGIVREIGWIRNEYIGYTIDCVYDTMAKAAGVDEAKCSRVGATVYVPVQTSMDYDGRVTKI